MNQQQQWATSLKRTQRTATILQKTPLATQEKDVNEMMNFNIEKLKQACTEKQSAVAEQYLEKLITLRAKQLAILLQKIQKDIVGYSSEKKQRAIDKYYDDCQKLTAAVSVWLAEK